ncbi:hypothetical protein PAHAL_1G365000 [Panicum hallii]|uniref:Uncharacterized protein n=1 Tax=Panicum hallii TaxID=206008 RepID=A0A2T8KXE3_9POAL|nr:hypothetical protein PAHAL_1G365000 [Panicum hallii]
MSSSWTDNQNKLFESLLAIYDEDTPDRWQKIAQAVGGGKSVEDVKRHYHKLQTDLQDIESRGGCQGSNRSSSGGSSSNGSSWCKTNDDKSHLSLKLVWSIPYFICSIVHLDYLSHPNMRHTFLAYLSVCTRGPSLDYPYHMFSKRMRYLKPQ